VPPRGSGLPAPRGGDLVTGAWLIQVVGAVVVFAVLQDVFFTVLFPASGHGLLRRPLTRWP